MMNPALVLCCAVAALADPTYLVWPPAQSISADGPQLPLAQNFKIEVGHAPSARLSGAIDRYTDKIATVLSKIPKKGSAIGVESLRVIVADPSNEILGLNTDYSYELIISEDGTAEARAPTVYGAMYAIDTFWQLVDEESGALKHSSVHINDAPAYQWRGLMIDSGRRFFPMNTVKNLLDTMAGNKVGVFWSWFY
jgi:hexosaminidase